MTQIDDPRGKYAVYDTLPQGLQNGMVMWIEHGVYPGSFLTAVLANNLTEAVFCADQFNYPRLREIVSWIHEHAPVLCYGDPDRMFLWAQRQGMEGKERVSR
jgi:hypothetical protein